MSLKTSFCHNHPSESPPSGSRPSMTAAKAASGRPSRRVGAAHFREPGGPYQRLMPCHAGAAASATALRPRLPRRQERQRTARHQQDGGARP